MILVAAVCSRLRSVHVLRPRFKVELKIAWFSVWVVLLGDGRWLVYWCAGRRTCLGFSWFVALAVMRVRVNAPASVGCLVVMNVVVVVDV